MEEVKLEEEVEINWDNIARLPGLIAQVDQGIRAATDLLSIIESTNSANKAYRSEITKIVGKREIQINAAVLNTANPLKINVAIAQVRDSILEEMKTVDAEILNIQSLVVDQMKVVLNEACVSRKDAEQEFMKKKSVCQNVKGQIVKKRANALKEWNSLQDWLRKLYIQQQALVTEQDDGKKVKIQKNIAKCEENINKLKTVTRNLFSEIEYLVKQGANLLNGFYVQSVPEYMKKLQEIDRAKNAKICDIIITYSQISKRCAEKVMTNCDRLEEKCSSDIIRGEEIALEQISIPADLRGGPETLKSGLPFLASDIEKAVKLVDLKVPPETSIDKLTKRASEAFSSLGQLFKKNQNSNGESSSDLLDDKEQKKKKKSVTFSVNSSSLKSFQNEKEPDENAYPSPTPKSYYGALRVRAYSEEEKRYVDEDDMNGESPQTWRAVAISDYSNDSNNNSEFLSFKTGDVVIVTDTSNSDWWVGYVENDSSGQVAYFPSSHVEISK
jgi:hypothetical protein